MISLNLPAVRLHWYLRKITFTFRNKCTKIYKVAIVFIFFFFLLNWNMIELQLKINHQSTSFIHFWHATTCDHWSLIMHFQHEVMCMYHHEDYYENWPDILYMIFHFTYHLTFFLIALELLTKSARKITTIWSKESIRLKVIFHKSTKIIRMAFVFPILGELSWYFYILIWMIECICNQ